MIADGHFNLPHGFLCICIYVNILTLSRPRICKILPSYNYLQAYIYDFAGQSATVSDLRPVLPTSHAIFMHKLRVYEEPLGEIIALTLTNGGDVVLLTDSDKKVCDIHYWHMATQPIRSQETRSRYNKLLFLTGQSVQSLGTAEVWIWRWRWTP